jgi:hypothetical protein
MNANVPDLVAVDTCVLLSNALRWLVTRLGGQRCFRPFWSPVIADEWRRNAMRIWGIDASDAADRWNALQREFPDACLDPIAAFKEGLKYSDPKDWHVIAAARAALAHRPGARVAVLTRNMKDFNRPELRRIGLGLYDPDQFLVHCLWAYPDFVTQALACLPGALHAPGRPVEPLADILRRERLFRLNRVIALPDFGAPARAGEGG